MQRAISSLKGYMTNLTSETSDFFTKPINLRGFREVPQSDTRNKRQLQEWNRVTPLSKMLREFLNHRENATLLKCSGFQGRFANLLDMNSIFFIRTVLYYHEIQNRTILSTFSIERKSTALPTPPVGGLRNSLNSRESSRSRETGMNEPVDALIRLSILTQRNLSGK